MTTNYRSYFRVYLLWHLDSADGKQFAEHLFRHICEDPDRPLTGGLSIPLYFRSVPIAAGTDAPRLINLDKCLNSATFILVDDKMVISQSWQHYIEQLWDDVSGRTPHHRIYPVALTPSSYNLSDKISGINFIRIYQETESKRQQEKLLRKVLHECCRQLKQITTEESKNTDTTPPAVRLFLSHAKQDGIEITKNFRRWIQEDEILNTFFDAQDIAPGYEFKKEIEAGLRDCALLIFQTDAYAGRYWCRWEVLKAKQYRIPLLSINAIKTGEERSFPYLGNIPTIRWQDSESIPTIITKVLLEVLRYCYFPQYVESLKQIGRIPPQATMLPCAPELLNQLQDMQRGKLEGDTLIIYPDPPLGDDEMEVLKSLNPNIKAMTPSQPKPSAATDGEKKPLSGKDIGISVSNSPDLERQGFSAFHLKEALTEISRHLLAQGASVAYGGDLRPDGFTQDLVEIVKAYNTRETEPGKKILNFLAWPLYLEATAAWQATYKKEVLIQAIPLPEDLKQCFGIDEQSFLKPDSTVNRYVWARCLTAMRSAMTEKIQARIILGGQVTNYKGAFPGLAEEAVLAIAYHKPLFVLGAFGGCARAVGEAMLGESPEVLTQAFQTAQSQDYAQMIEFYIQQANQGAPHEPIDYTALVEKFRNTDFRNLNNGLTESENQLLFETEDLDEMVYLILKGLQHT